MTLLLQWIICVICSQILIQIWLTTVLKPYGGLVKVLRDGCNTDKEVTDDEKFKLDKVPDNFLSAFILTIILITNIIAWPAVLCVMIYYKIYPDKFTEGLRND